jgi:hypothetical protein
MLSIVHNFVGKVQIFCSRVKPIRGQGRRGVLQGASTMNPVNRDFPELYRAAFAERDPEKKLLLLSQVQKVIKPWEHDETRMTGPSSAQAQTSSKAA